jgi:hypothetical protein
LRREKQAQRLLAQVWKRADTAKVVESLVVPEAGLGLFRLKKGSTIGGKALNTDYVAFALLVTVPVDKVECS